MDDFCFRQVFKAGQYGRRISVPAKRATLGDTLILEKASLSPDSQSFKLENRVVVKTTAQASSGVVNVFLAKPLNFEVGDWLVVWFPGSSRGV